MAACFRSHGVPGYPDPIRETDPSLPAVKHYDAALKAVQNGTKAYEDTLDTCSVMTVVALAEEADVKRHVLTHHHTDLKNLFYAQVRAQGQIPDSERLLRQELDTTRHRLAEANEHIKNLENDNNALARIVNVRATENDQFRDELQDTSTSVIRPLR